MALTANDFLNQIIAQARLLDPSASFEVLTPEYKIASAVAQSLASNQVDMTGVANALNINSKVGSTLDNFTSLFGMQRQQGTPGTGYVVFSRPSNSPAPAPITIPQGTVIQANNINTNTPTTIQYATTQAGTIAQGQTSSGSVPVQAITAGSATNVPANSLTIFAGTIPNGVTSVNNPTAINNGTDNEDDDIFKARFQNTWARNLSGTSSSYLAVALAGAFTTKAVCVGNQSTYTEYIQVPNYDDSGRIGGVAQNYPAGSLLAGQPANTGGLPGQWTSALSDIPYAKQIFTNVPTFISDASSGVGNYYYQSGVDYTFNYPPLITGDAIREIYTISSGSSTISGASASTVNVSSTVGFPEWGTIGVINAGALILLQYTTITSTTFGIPAGGNQSGTSFTLASGSPVYYIPNNALNINEVFTVQPNFTFLNVNTGSTTASNGTTIAALTPGDIILSEFRYVSTASRNDIALNINNCVDAYVNGSNPQQQTTTFLPTVSLPQFSVTPTSTYYIENYRRDGQPQKRPQIGNYFTPLFNPPVLSLPSYIQGQDGSYYFLGIHYWLVHEIGTMENSTRTRDGIEWNASLIGDANSSPQDTTSHNFTSTSLTPYNPTNIGSNSILTYASNKQPLTLTYTNDANIIGIQATLDANAPIHTDAVVHGAVERYFKLWLAMQYSANAAPSVVQSSVQAAVQTYLNNQYFGTVIQLSSLLDAVASTSGVQNVRWFNDLPIPQNEIRVIETDINGNQIQGVSIDRWQYGIAGSRVEIEYLYIVGNNFGANDFFTLTWSGDPAWAGGSNTFSLNPSNISPLTPTASATYIQGRINSVITTAAAGTAYNSGVVVTPLFPTASGVDQWPIDPANPIMIFSITYNASGSSAPYLPTVTQSITQGTYLYNQDFFLMDDQLPTLPTGQSTNASTLGVADTLPGLIITNRAENTFYRG